MRYLVLSADYRSFSLRDEAAAALNPVEQLSADLLRRLGMWNERYQPVIPADTSERSTDPLLSLIRELDAEGLLLAAEIAAALPDTKVAYYSEGELRRLPSGSNA